MMTQRRSLYSSSQEPLRRRCLSPDGLFVDVTDHDLRHFLKGRISQFLAELNFLVVKGPIILASGTLDDVMIRCIGLHDDAARHVASAGPASRLGEKLKGPFPGPVSRQVEQTVRREDSNGTDAGKVMALGDHLRS